MYLFCCNKPKFLLGFAQIDMDGEFEAFAGGGLTQLVGRIAQSGQHFVQHIFAHLSSSETDLNLSTL